MDELRRCGWPLGDAPMLRYHDEEWGVPVHDDCRHFEFLILEGAQAGLSWRTILHKRDAYRRAYEGFDPKRVAGFGVRQVQRLLGDAGIVRNRFKIESSIRNAQAFLRIQEEFTSFNDYIWRFVDGKPRRNAWRHLKQLPCRTPESDALSKDLKAQGYFVRTNIRYGRRPQGGYKGEMDVVAFQPSTRTPVHLETSGDAGSWEHRKARFRRKFRAATKHYSPTFKFKIKRIEQVAVAGWGRSKRATLGNGIKLLTVRELMEQVRKGLKKVDEAHAVIPEGYPMLRAIQFALRSMV